MREAVFTIGIVSLAGLGYYLYQVKVMKRDAATARANAAAWAFRVWKQGSFEMPGRLASRGLTEAALREIGHVLKAELVGRSTVTNLPREIARSHPELVNIDSVQLAREVHHMVHQERIQFRG